MSIWEKEAPKCHKQLVKLIEPFNTGTELSSGSCLSAMTTNNASNQSIELFMELFTDSMIGFLAQMGYPADKFEINIKFSWLLNFHNFYRQIGKNSKRIQ